MIKCSELTHRNDKERNLLRSIVGERVWLDHKFHMKRWRKAELKAAIRCIEALRKTKLLERTMILALVKDSVSDSVHGGV